METLNKGAIQKNINDLKQDWQMIDGKLALKLTLKNFPECVKVINKISKIAEKENHHPDIKVYNYNKLLIEIHTHSLNTLTQKDFELAKRIENLIQITDVKVVRE